MEEVTLPELPPDWQALIGGYRLVSVGEAREYARAAVRMERERAGRGALDVSVTKLLLRQPQPTIADAIRDAVLAERERCAKAAESRIDPEWPGDDLSAQASGIAAAIRGAQ